MVSLEVEVGERPVLGPAGEPQVREVIADVRHHVRLGGDQILDGLDASRQVLRRRLRRCGGRSLLAAASRLSRGRRRARATPRDARIMCRTSPSLTIEAWTRGDHPWPESDRIDGLGGLSCRTSETSSRSFALAASRAAAPSGVAR